jgi:pimeloyl-ACP methyl ester carboxylesterase
MMNPSSIPEREYLFETASMVIRDYEMPYRSWKSSFIVTAQTSLFQGSEPNLLIKLEGSGCFCSFSSVLISSEHPVSAKIILKLRALQMSLNKIVKLLLKYFLLPLLLLVLVVSFSLLSYRSYLQHRLKVRTAILSPNGIDSLEKINLGGADQWILIRGQDVSNPILLYLHGGPGSADMAIARYFDSELEKKFVVVHWDQRGAGKSYDRRISPQSMTVEQFISDTRELAQKLKARFHADRIYLVGHSWGSALGALTASKYPDLFYAFVGIGQFVDSEAQEVISYQFALLAAKQSKNTKAMQELQKIGPPPYADYKELLVQRKWLEEFGGVRRSNLGFTALLKLGIASPDYTLLDLAKYFQGQDFSSTHLWVENSRVNLFNQAPRIDVPVYFFLGRYDYNTPFELAEKYYEQLDAPRGKKIIWFENSAHMVPYDEPGKFSRTLIDVVLAETYEAAKVYN